MKFAEPILLASKCLKFDNCGYDGNRLNSSLVYKLQKFVKFIPVCREVVIGLGTTRTPICIINIEKELKLLEFGTDRDLTDKVNNGDIGLEKQKISKLEFLQNIYIKISQLFQSLMMVEI